MRSLIDRIVLTPVCRDGKETLSITLRADLAGILGLAGNEKGPLAASDPVAACTKLVAGDATIFFERRSSTCPLAA